MKRPTEFYKYHSAKNSYSITNLNDSMIYLSHPKEFNDPHDCVGLLITDYPKRFDIDDTTYKKLASEVGKEFDIEFEKEQNGIKEFIAEIIEQVPLYCLSETGGEPLMWAHYSDGLRGFCIEFSGTAGFLKPAVPVDYNTLPEPTDIYKVMLQCLASAQKNGIESEQYLDRTKIWMKKLFCTKLKCWEYEKEWRIGRAQQDKTSSLKKTIKYEKTDILSIILGERMSNGNKKLIKDIVHWTYGNNVKLKIASIENDGIVIKDLNGNFY